MNTRILVVEKAREYLGTPYKHQGRVKHVGVDCIGLILGAWLEAGLGDWDCKAYQRYRRHPPRGNEMMQHAERMCGKPKTEVEVGDMAAFWVSPTSKKVQHVALIGNFEPEYGFSLIHCYSDIGKVVEHYYDEEWRERFVASFNPPKSRWLH